MSLFYRIRQFLARFMPKGFLRAQNPGSEEDCYKIGDTRIEFELYPDKAKIQKAIGEDIMRLVCYGNRKFYQGFLYFGTVEVNGIDFCYSALYSRNADQIMITRMAESHDPKIIPGRFYRVQ